ncbi:mandelate racemase/muconate lactonizing enzyme family protein [Bradyrhizobium sp. BEA-2-5]|uniref:mandelate racemase/muconate lactonizing enzyme family protein n=1 Tax=Bradyrhizobium sp. BEA-2-5 TaxID=3080015 RepID=UPI00293ED4D9|nr:mandelate racemase/muconate lactonizing enzyme family protein [Bradyrhizobium sp. BEA-2-5]WOH83120.1 mandelate racemase/muconate lactonizing enzyme family protein [Bradyrhizobium sp. BEA-2-5]
MAILKDLSIGFYKIPLPVVLSDSTHGEIKAFELVTIRARDADGAEGTGYTYTVGRNGGAIADILGREITEIAREMEADDTEQLWHKVWWALHYGGRGGPTVLALSALDIALWDLKARRASMPLWRLLGGFDRRVPCYAGGIDLDLPLDGLLTQTDGNLAKGFRAIKMKVGRPSLASDVARVKAMRGHLGDGFPLMVDANMKWTVEEAIRAARAFVPYDLTWLEEPIIPDDVAGHVRIMQAGGVPIAAGENLHSLWEFKNYIASGAVSYPEPDVTNCGGVSAFMKIARLAEAFNLPVTSHGAHDITVHLLAACPNRSYLEAHGFGLDKYIEHPLVLEQGMAIAPDRPGHGIAFDWTGLERLGAA